MPTLYDGYVSIKFTCLQSTSKLVMHMSGLQIDNSSLEMFKLENSTNTSSPSNSNLIKQFSWTHDQTKQFFIADFGRDYFLKGNNYTFNVAFQGILKDDNAGFYSSSYTDSSGNKKYN